MTVLSTLARMNLDPWEEAARLSTLSRPEAAQSLVLTLNGSSEHLQEPLETEIIVSRLVTLLPVAPSAQVNAPQDNNGKRILRSDFWLIWLCIQLLLLTLMSFRGNTMVEGASDAGSHSGAAESLRGKSPAPDRSDVSFGRTESTAASSSNASSPRSNER